MVKSKLKYIQSLSHKKHRDEEGVFIAEGPKIINELLNEHAFEPVEIFALHGWRSSQLPSIQERTTEVDEQDLSRMSTLVTANQVLGIFRMPVHPPFEAQGKLSILLNGIQDPGNLGTIIRIADWFGVEQVVCSLDCVDVFNPKVVQSTMGSIARVKVHYEDLATILELNKGTDVYAATLQGTDVRQMPAVKEGLLIIGNESKGIEPALLDFATKQITIARKGKAESLNAAVATGIILHALTH